MRKSLGALVGALCVMLLVSACAAQSGESGEPDNSAQIEAGREIYETGGAAELPCSTCHSLDGSALVGPSLNGISERAATRVEGVSAEDYLHQSITTPSQYVVPDFTDAMPKIYAEKLTEEDIQNVIAFLMTQ